ncbi:hypothetical protein DFH09DRAFT_1303405 [Mycena vulgaris]|nr:hypothetical protein DFH09DRAFT_1303405 [Mycena vulgaris]
MLRGAESFLAKLSLEKRLTDPPPAPLADRLSDPPYSPLPPPTSLAQRMACSAPPLASRISEPEEPPPKRQKRAAVQSRLPPPRPRPAFACGIAVQAQAARGRRRRLSQRKRRQRVTSLLSWIPTLAVAEEEAREMEEIDGAAGWSHEGDDDDDIAPIAGPSRLH